MELHATLGVRASGHQRFQWRLIGVGQRRRWFHRSRAWLQLREKIRPAGSAHVANAKFFAQRAKNRPKRAIFAVLGESFRGACLGWGLLGEFCRGERMSGGLLGVFCRGGRPPAAVLGEFFRGIRHNPASRRGSPLRPARPVATDKRPEPRPRPLALAGEGEVHEEQVQRDDDGRDEEAGDAQGAIVRVAAHDVALGGQAHERDDREGDAE